MMIFVNFKNETFKLLNSIITVQKSQMTSNQLKMRVKEQEIP